MNRAAPIIIALTLAASLSVVGPAYAVRVGTLQAEKAAAENYFRAMKWTQLLGIASRRGMATRDEAEALRATAQAEKATMEALRDLEARLNRARGW